MTGVALAEGGRLVECPKSMEYGPCGGVRADGRCEVAEHRCVFLGEPVRRWSGIDRRPGSTPKAGERTPAAARMLELIASRPIVVADFPAQALSLDSIRDCAAVLRGSVDAVLAGDAGTARVQFPPSLRAQLIAAEGLNVWTGFNNRDRNRVALEGELAGLAVAGASGVHCVTGDHTLTGHRPDARPVFDLDSTETAALARSFGHLVSVGESPATEPVAARPARLAEKVRAGADICFVNHCGGVDAVADFIARAADLGGAAGYIPCIPLVIDQESAALLRSFTSLVLPEGYLDSILEAADPLEGGIEAAVRLSSAMLEVPGVVGVDLSGGRDGGESLFAEAMARIAARLAL